MRPPWFIRYEDLDTDLPVHGPLVLVIDPYEWAWRTREAVQEARKRLVEAWKPLDLSGPLTSPWPWPPPALARFITAELTAALDRHLDEVFGSGPGIFGGIQGDAVWVDGHWETRDPGMRGPSPVATWFDETES